MIPLEQVAALAQSAAEGAAAVASRWDVIAAAFVGGWARDFVNRRREDAKVAAHIAKAAAQAADAAVVAHVDACPAARAFSSGK